LIITIPHREIIDNVCSLIDKKGPEFWWQCSVEEIVPESVLSKFNVSYDQLELGKVLSSFIIHLKLFDGIKFIGHSGYLVRLWTHVVYRVGNQPAS
jgi:hypothetical protein